MPDKHPRSARALLASAAQRIGPVDAEWLLLHVLGRSRTWLFTHPDTALPEKQAQAYAGLVGRRAAGEPVAYLTGRRGFWSMDLELTPATLIPRPETELLVEFALQQLPPDARVLDLGTGCGAIALAIARERPDARVIAVERRGDALAVARRNAESLGIANVEFRHGDWFTPVAGLRFDCIVSNPPYIADADPHLRQGDLRFEPRSALVSGADGLDDLRRIVAAAPAHLQPEGRLLVEHGWQQGSAVRALFRAAGFAQVKTHADLEERDRVSTGGLRKP